jgi:hypothetical protein
MPRYPHSMEVAAPTRNDTVVSAARSTTFSESAEATALRVKRITPNAAMNTNTYTYSARKKPSAPSLMASLMKITCS